jgi:hypothetical protein
VLTVTTVAKLVSTRFGDVADYTLGPDQPVADHASGGGALRLGARRTDELGRPLSIFNDHRRGWKVDIHSRGLEGA